MTSRLQLGQFFTPAWAAEALVEQHFGDLTLCDTVLEPSCGPGAFLSALPDHVPALGVEIDPELAERARVSTGRAVLVGDFTEIELPVRPTAIIGNPPFRLATMEAFLRRAQVLLPDEGRCGFILPVFAFQTASTACRISRGWRIEQQFLPRDLFPRLRLPLCWVILRKSRRGKLVNFALYHEAVAIPPGCRPATALCWPAVSAVPCAPSRWQPWSPLAAWPRSRTCMRKSRATGPRRIAGGARRFASSCKVSPCDWTAGAGRCRRGLPHEDPPLDHAAPRKAFAPVAT